MYPNVYNSLRPHFLMSKVLGYALFSFDFKSFEVVVRKSDAVFGVLNILLTFLLNFVYWNSIFKIEFERFEIVKCFFPTVTYINFIIFTSAKVWIYYQRKNLGKLHKILFFVDKELLTLGFKFDYNQHRKIVLTHMGCINLVHLIFCCFFLFSKGLSEMDLEKPIFLFTSWGFMSCLSLVSHFMILVWAVRERFKAVSSIIE